MGASTSWNGGKVAPIPLEGNWKLVLETFLESYHFNYAHRDNLAQYYHGNCNTVDKMGRHLRTCTVLKSITTQLKGTPVETWVPEKPHPCEVRAVPRHGC